jgi:multidrug resistance efflux pump
MSDITKETWEDLSVLNSFNARHSILNFYLSNSGSGGKQTVVDVWKLLSDEDDLPRYANASQMVKRLQMIIEKDAKNKEKLEEARAKEAQVKASKKAAKIALKSKKVTKKAKRGESA